MDLSHLKRMRELISTAKDTEAKTGNLESLIFNARERLHESIEFTDDNVAASLYKFIEEYIEHVPNFIEAIANVTDDAEIYDYAEGFLNAAADYFITPPKSTSVHKGIDALLDGAYLAHRLIEEINDRFITRCNCLLAPMDMTRANLIMHDLIGEPFASDLDSIAQHSVEQLMIKESIFDDERLQQYISMHQHRGWTLEIEEWPCLAQDLDINLAFSKDMRSPTKLH